MKKHFKLGILITLLCLIFVGGCNSGDKMTEDEFYESISSAENKEDLSESTENKDETHESVESFENSNPTHTPESTKEPNPTQTPEPTKEPDPTSEPKPTDKPSKNTGNVLVTIHAPLIFKDFDEIQTEELTSLLEKMSIYDMSNEATCKVLVSRDEPFATKLTEAAKELIEKNEAIQTSADIALSTKTEIALNNLIFNETGTELDAECTSYMYDTTFAEMNIPDGAELHVTALYNVTKVAENTVERYVPCKIEAYILKTDVPDSTEIDRTIFYVGSMKEDIDMRAPKSEDCKIKWKQAVGSKKVYTYATASGYLNDFYLEIKPTISPENYFTGEYKEKDFENTPGALSTYTVFTVTYTDARPDIVLISPEGEVYSSSHENDLYFSKTEADGKITMSIYKTYKKPWTVRVYKKGTETVYVTMSYR